MNEPVIVKNTFPIALVAALQRIGPALVAVGMLYSLIFVYDVGKVQDYFHAMAVLVALIMLLMPYPTRTPNSQIFAATIPLAFTVLIRWFILLGVLLAIAYVAKFSQAYSRRIVLIWATVTPAVLLLFSALLHEIMRRLLCHPSNARKAVFAGYNEVSQSVAKRLASAPEFCMYAAGFFDDRGADRLQIDSGDRLLGKLTDLAAYVKQRGIQVIFIALPVRHMQRVTALLDDLRDTTASIYYIPDILVFDLIQARSGSINGIPVVAMCETPFYGLRGVTKRIMDISISSLAMLLLLPFAFFIALIIRLSSPGPVIFRQRRYGLDGEEIVVYKFRTMTVLEDGAVVPQATKDDARTTAVGRFLRRYSLDELPQLMNVLQGRMSLVGPRPHAVSHNEMYRKLIKGYMVRHKVRPGITGLAQVKGLRGETRTVEQMEARVKYDLEYLRNWTPMLDVKILLATAVTLLGNDQAY
jgi:putative colanic acid biosysnthesis UDP-glucose lipid carrier transferase